jgi:hypothetical protein
MFHINKTITLLCASIITQIAFGMNMATKLDLAKSAALAHETLAVAHADQADQEALQNL